jgi:hypothetical protein
MVVLLIVDALGGKGRAVNGQFLTQQSNPML